MQPHPHTVFVNRPPRRNRTPRLLLGSVVLAAALLAALALLGQWEAGASHTALPTVAAPAAAGGRDPSVPAASEVLRNAEPVPDEAVSTF